MKQLIGYLLVLVLAVFGHNAKAQVSFSIIPPSNVIAGQQFRVVYQLKNGNGTSINAPQIAGCDLLYGPATSTSSQTYIVNGQATSSYNVSYSYTYRASKEGNYTIPAASIIVDGKKIIADSKNFSVLPADKVSSQNSSTTRIDDISTQTADKPIDKNDLFVRIIPSKTSVYVNEPIECTVKLYSKYQVGGSSTSITNPKYDGFLAEDIDVSNQSAQMENYNGQNYMTSIIKRFVLFPQKSGKLNVTSGSYDLEVQQIERVNYGFYTAAHPVTRKVRISEYSTSINVKPLPTPAPVGFDNAVGNFTISSSLTPQSLRTNEAAKLTITISGTGNLKFLHFPETTLPSEFETYTPATNINAAPVGGTIKGSIQQDITFVPRYPGNFEIPSTVLVFFNPADGKYHTISSESYTLDIAKGNATTVRIEDTPGIQSNASDIRHIYLGDKSPSKNHSYLVDSLTYWLIYLIITIGLISTIILIKKRAQRNGDIIKRKASKANKIARKHLSAASAALSKGNNDLFYDALLKAIWGYLGDKLAIPASQLTRQEVTDRLNSSDPQHTLSNEVVSLIDDCEIARYTPDSPELHPKVLIQQAENVIRDIEQSIRKH